MATNALTNSHTVWLLDTIDQVYEATHRKRTCLASIGSFEEKRN